MSTQAESYEVDVRTVVMSGPRSTYVRRDATLSVEGGLVASVPRDQLYYWTSAWQENERAALRELADGECREFDSGDDAIRWLLSDDED